MKGLKYSESQIVFAIKQELLYLTGHKVKSVLAVYINFLAYQKKKEITL
ncbi:hypothetical protein ZORO111902_18905 [Zobellia roscoffensis]